MSFEDIPQPVPDLRVQALDPNPAKEREWARPTEYSYSTYSPLLVPTDCRLKRGGTRGGASDIGHGTVQYYGVVGAAELILRAGCMNQNWDVQLLTSLVIGDFIPVICP